MKQLRIELAERSIGQMGFQILSVTFRRTFEYDLPGNFHMLCEHESLRFGPGSADHSFSTRFIDQHMIPIKHQFDHSWTELLNTVSALSRVSRIAIATMVPGMLFVVVSSYAVTPRR
jgi:hypothetical protein